MITIKTRDAVFETNSSSTHSLSLSEDFSNMVESPLSDYQIKQGIVTISSGEYGWEVETYTDWLTKASYLYTDAMIGCDSSIDPNDEFFRNENIKLSILCKAIKEYTGVDVFFEKSSDKYYPFGYIDHQSVGECGQVWDEDVSGVIRFLFSIDSVLETSNDNM